MADITKKTVLEEMAGDQIDIDSTEIELYSVSDILAEIPATISLLLTDETGFIPYNFSGSVNSDKNKSFIESEGEFSLDITGTTPDKQDFCIITKGNWFATDFITIEQKDGDSIKAINRLSIICEITNIIKI